MADTAPALMTGKIAIITGASRGLGRNTALNLAIRGVDLIFTCRSHQSEGLRLCPPSRTCVHFRTISQSLCPFRRSIFNGLRPH